MDTFCNNGLSHLAKYLNMLFKDCPDSYFMKGPRSSSLRFDIKADVREVHGHEVCGLARAALKTGMYKTSHSNVQVFMLENDNKTISAEVPIWIEHDELSGFYDIFKTEDPLTGHIDLLRVEDGLLWVWDFKPSAEKEVYAATQVFFYALMISKRAGIPLEKIRCGYFDDNYAFVFKPEMELLKNAVKADS